MVETIGGAWAQPLPDAAPRVKSWFYQLQKVDPEAVAKIRADVKVIDWTIDGSNPWPKSAIDKMRGKGEKIIAYVSIGEAEDYRPYWLRAWKWKKPGWMDEENPDWLGNFKVRFWAPEWKAIVRDMMASAIRSGFDGVYLDIIDAYEYWHARGISDADRRMIAFVREISAFTKGYAAGEGRDFWIIPQNGEGLLRHADYRAAIDAIGIEDLFYGAEDGDGTPNDHEFSVSRIDDCTILKNEGKPVLVVEYGPLPPTHASVTDAIRHCGFVPYVTTRPLDKPTEPPK